MPKIWIAVLVVAPIVAIAVGVKLMQPRETQAAGGHESIASSPTLPPGNSPSLLATPTLQPPQPSPDVEQLRRQLAIQEAQADSLRQQLAAQKAVASAPTAPPVTATDVCGAAWISRSDGTSDIVRGMKVELLPDTIPSTVLATRLGREPDNWKRFLDDVRGTKGSEWSEMAEALGDLAPKVDLLQVDFLQRRAAQSLARNRITHFGDYVTTRDAYLAVDACYIDRYKAIEDAISTGGTFASAMQAENNTYAAAVQSTINRYRSEISEDVHEGDPMPEIGNAIASTRTDVSGKYVMHGIPAGEYCLHAVVNGERGFYEWAENLKVGEQPVTLDLSTDNAVASNFNRSPR
jgi:hypothetical protein